MSRRLLGRGAAVVERELSGVGFHFPKECAVEIAARFDRPTLD